MKTQKFNFNLKGGKPTDEQLIYIITIFKGERVKISTGKKCLGNMWDCERQRCKTGKIYSTEFNKKQKEINKHLDKLVEDLSSLFKANENFLYKGNYMSELPYIKHLIGVFTGREKERVRLEEQQINRTPLEYFQHYVDTMDKLIVPSTGTFINPRTIIHHQTVLRRFKAFFKECNINDSFDVFDDRFSLKFETWAYTSKGYKSNTIPASFSVLKVWLNAAKKEGLVKHDLYMKYRSKSADVDNIYLTKDEITRLYKLDIPMLKKEGKIDLKSKCEITRDLFIVGCKTGLRASDLSRLNEADINLKNNTISVIAEKTKKKSIIPIHPYVLEIYNKYNNRFPRANDKAHSIRHLQHLGELAEINEIVLIKENRAGRITTIKYLKYQLIVNHTARRSFATNLYLDGASSKSIMDLTGHTTEQNFLKYIKVSKEENAELMQKYFKD